METYIWQRVSRFVYYFLGVLFAAVGFAPMISLWQFYDDTSFPYDIQGEEYVEGSETTDIASELIKNDTQNQTSLLQRLTNYFRLSGTEYDDPTTPATNYIKWILNILLWLVSFLSLVMIIFAFYLIFFSKGEEAVGKAKKILIGVGIALAIMWLSRFIASFFFDIYGTVTGA